MGPRKAINGVSTPSKRRVSIFAEDEKPDADGEEGNEVEFNATPTKRRKVNATPNATASRNSRALGGLVETPVSVSQRKPLQTPSRTIPDSEDEISQGTVGARIRNADRSARRKSAGRLLSRALVDVQSEDDASEEEDILAQQILEDQEDGAGVDEDEEEQDLDREEDPIPDQPPETPLKRKRGRPKKIQEPKKVQKEETPPLHLPFHERYFWDNRPGAAKTSNNTFPSQLLMNHEEYFDFKSTYISPHSSGIDRLLGIHEESFPQWACELDFDLNICLHGFGSKTQVMQAFASYLWDRSESKAPKIIVVNGYEPSTTIRQILTALADTIFPTRLKLPTHANMLHQLIIDTLSEKPPKDPIYLLLNSLDAQALRRNAIQVLLAGLAQHPSIKVVATCDTPNFPLMWDLNLRRQFNWVYHECTTFAPYHEEIDVVETVNTLLGRSSRRVGGRDGVGYVLRSLPENARNLYRIVVAEQLAVALEEDGEERDGGASASSEGIEYRILYHKAREELVCSTEHQFRTLLKEFYDHQMVESKRDALGSERLIVPFRKDELEGLLEDLVE